MMSQPLLNYQIYGEDNTGLPLLVLHGMMGELQNWNSQSRLFAENYRVIAADLRNHGASPHADDMSYRLMADDVAYLIEHLGLSKVYLCGHSMGGKTAMYLAQTQPELIKKLVVVDIAPVAYPLWHQGILAALQSLSLGEFKSRSEFDQHLQEAIPDPFERAFLLKNVVRDEQGFRWKCNLAAIVRNYLKIATFPEMDTVFTGETLFIKGAESNYIDDRYATDIKRYFPQAQMVTIDNAGHLPHVQQPQAFHQVLGNFLQA